jgi:asparaginyl-tRNA synthetase
MKRVRIRSVLTESYIGKEITICGWVRTKRESKGLVFIALSDGSTQDTLQLVISEETPAFDKVHQCTTGTAIKVTGIAYIRVHA